MSKSEKNHLLKKIVIVSPSHFFAEKKFQFIPQETPVITLQHRLYIYNYTVKYVLGKICNICYVFLSSATSVQMA